MLELKNIVKDYPAGGEVVHALRGVDLQFRKSEFVAILGPSGCGKTTMLNIIGGLDQYSSGDLVINGRSTKGFHDREWDTYRNHSVGFVFQSYNLIPHQTVLQNVELALTLSGVSRQERRRRAIKALEDVGLSSQIHKRPGEMSGGQMQRVAIARAIVNDPDIILADEPTGALDTETSVQVMDILKEISRDRLVVMVTHNPDLAERYATRVVRMLDGQITDDSDPIVEEAADTVSASAPSGDIGKKPSMSIWTSFGLSLKNLFTKKGRTALTAFAGSIGIIGIALIYAVSQGATDYIDTVQEETLTSYPLTLEAETIDLGTLMETFVGKAQSEEKHEKDAIYQKALVYDMINSLSSLETTVNDLRSFKSFLEARMADENDDTGLRDAVSGVQYSYDMDIPIYTENVDGTILHSDTTELMREMIAQYMGVDAENMEAMGGSSSPMASMMTGNNNSTALWREMLGGKDGKLISDVFYDQYDIVYGDWPTKFDEIILVVDENYELDDLTLYALGLIPKGDIDAIMNAVNDKTELDAGHKHWTYEEICNMEFRTILPSDCYAKDEATGLYSDLRETDAGLRYLYANATPLKVKGIISPKESAVSTILKDGSIGYTTALTEYVITRSQQTEIVAAQKADPDTDVFTGKPFKTSSDNMDTAQKAEAFRSYLTTLDEQAKADAYVKIMSVMGDEQLNESVGQIMATMTRERMEASMMQTLSSQMSVDAESIEEYIASMSDEELTKLFEDGVRKQVAKQYADQVAEQMKGMPAAQLAAALDQASQGYTDEQCAAYYDDVLEFSESTYEDNLILLGCVDMQDPATINLYAASFEDKDVIEDAIAEYNRTVDELHEIRYTDYVGIIMSSVTTIIHAITYVLIAFVAISLIVSSIMIGVITLISVQERTKEIGILRAIGASKRNVSSMFNAETVIIGFSSGLLGILITYLLCIPINIILHALTGISNLSANLPISVAAVLVIISILLTLISGIIPSRSAAKKDPVVALRTE